MTLRPVVVHPMSAHPMSAHLDSLAWRIDRVGYDAVTQQYLREIGPTAEQAGVRPDLIDLLNDESTPTPVRNRTFGLVAGFINRHLSGSQPPTTGEPVSVTDDQVVCAA